MSKIFYLLSDLNIGMILILVSSIIIARILNVMICSRLINWGSEINLDFKKQFFLCFSGVRGAMAFALAFKSSIDLDVGKLFLLITLIYSNITLLYSSIFTSFTIDKCDVLEAETIIENNIFTRFKTYIANVNDRYFMKAVYRDEDSLLGSRKTSQVGWRRNRKIHLEYENTEIPLSNAFLNFNLKIRNQHSFSVHAEDK